MKKVAIIGLGTMGSAIQKLLQDDFDVVGIDRQQGQLAEVTKADVVILAVKPQSFTVLAQELKPYIQQQLVISIMAGLTLRTLSDSLGTERIVRTMPNLALATGQSMTAWFTEARGVETETRQSILGAWGSNIELERERQFYAFTALAGSGPAYYFQLAHSLEQAAMHQGFTAEQARQISLQTFRGAASVLDSNASPGDWVKRVASKGGTTEAALKVLDEHGLRQIINTAIEAACARSREIDGS